MQGKLECVEERALVVALQAGDRNAPRTLVELYRNLVYSLCYRMLGHREDAEDVSQETFLRAIRGIDGFDSERPFRPWLLGIAANRCRTAISRRRRLPGPLAGDEQPADSRPLAPGSELTQEVERALSGLRPEYREVFTLFHGQGLPYEEISRRVNRPVGTVKTWLHRARLALAEELTRRGYTL